MAMFHRKGNRLKMLAALPVLGALAAGAISPAAAVKAKNMEMEKSFNVSRLHLKNVAGEVTVNRHRGKTTLVKYSGKKPLDTVVMMSVKGGRLDIVGKPNVSTVISKSGGGSSTVIVGSNTHVVIGNGASSTVVIGNKVERVTSGNTRWKLSISVPAGQPLDLAGFISRLTVGNIDAAVNAKIDGAGDLTFGSIKASKFLLAGAGTATVEKIRGDLHVEVLGAADVTVEDGRIDNLYVKVEGAGDVRVGGKVRRAKLISVGSGDIQIDRIAEKPQVSVTGAGDVNFERGT